MKIRYVGQSFFAGEGLTNGKVYTCLGVEGPFLRVVDDSDEDYLYDSRRPAPMNPKEGRGGRWRIVEDDEKGTLRKAIMGGHSRDRVTADALAVERDHVLCKDGRKGTIICVFAEPRVAYAIEYDGAEGDAEIIEADQVEQVIASVHPERH